MYPAAVVIAQEMALALRIVGQDHSLDNRIVDRDVREPILFAGFEFDREGPPAVSLPAAARRALRTRRIGMS